MKLTFVKFNVSYGAIKTVSKLQVILLFIPISNGTKILTRMFLLPHSENCVILCLFIWIGYQRVTDRRDGIAVAITALRIASNAAAL